MRHDNSLWVSTLLLGVLAITVPASAQPGAPTNSLPARPAESAPAESMPDSGSAAESPDGPAAVARPDELSIPGAIPRAPVSAPTSGGTGTTLPDPAEKSAGAAPAAGPIQPVQPPADVVMGPDQRILEYLMSHDYFNRFEDNRFNPDQPVSRAEFATLLYRAAGYAAPFISEFAYFTDVLTDHWAYLPIEKLRVTGIVSGSPAGAFSPEDPLTRLSAGIMVSRTMEDSSLHLNADQVTETLTRYGLNGSLKSSGTRYHTARAIYAGMLLPLSILELPPDADPADAIALGKPMTRIQAARLIYDRALWEAGNQTAQAASTAMLPADLKLTVTPTSAIFKDKLQGGQVIFFALSQPVTLPATQITLNAGSRLHGLVAHTGGGTAPAEVVFDRLLLPDGQTYNTHATVFLDFPERKDQKAPLFLVPGNLFEVLTLPVPTTP